MTIASVSMTEGPPAVPPATPDAVVDGRQVRFEEHHRLIFHTAYRVTGNASDAEDVLQTIFLRLLNRPPESLDTAKAGGYLRRAAINASLDLLRSRKRSRLVALDQQVLEEVGPSSAVESDPVRRFASLELRDRLRRELANVNPRAAEMFVLRYFEGYRNSEIGPMLGTSRMTVAVTLHRLRKRLAAALAEEDAAGAAAGGLEQEGRKDPEDQVETRRVPQ
ncbi:MAG: sigma-70 family RNA polymerase sigma factor [Holophagales bacterium]|nr:sigma-70 family RNA polymerase sigma factor [Holophagales bacterium]